MSQQKSGGNKKSPNKRPGYYAGYYMMRYPVNKLRRILRNNGLNAAEIWARTNKAEAFLKRLLNTNAKVRAT